MDKSRLLDKIYGSLIGGAIGDAMGGPVEMLDYDEISKRFGHVNTLLPYDHIEPNPHGPFSKEAGAYTDDTRLRNLILDAYIKKGQKITYNDLAKEIIERYHGAVGLEKEWLDEYYYTSIYRFSKDTFGGQSSNGGVMSASVFGLINIFDENAAFIDAYNTLFFVRGYSRQSSGYVASLTASAFKNNFSAEKIVEEALNALSDYKKSVEGEIWRNSDLYFHSAIENERLIAEAIKVAEKHDNPNSLKFKEEFYQKCLQKYKYDGSETAAIVTALLLMCGNDFEKAITAAVNLGRDNDSSATVLGAIIGANIGAEKINKEWVETVESANAKKEGSIYERAIKVCDILSIDYLKKQELINNYEKI